MKTKSIIALSVVFQMIFAFMQGACVAQSADVPEEYADIFNVSEDNAYILFGEDVIENGMDFLDGIEMGIEDTSHPLWNEVSTEQGITGRKFYIPNYLTFNVDKFTEEDTEFLIYITYYDFGPSQGSFLLEYANMAGHGQSVKIVKPGTVQRYNTECLYLQDINFNANYGGSGGCMRIKTNGYNLFKKIEIVSLSRFKKEGKSLSSLSYISPSKKRDNLIGFKLMDADDPAFKNENLINDCKYSDVAELFGRISAGKPIANPSNYAPDDVVTQKDLVLIAFDMLGIDCGDTPPIDHALKIGIVKRDDFLYSAELPASYYSLAGIVNNVMFFEDAQKVTPIEKMINEGFWDEKTIKSNRTLIAYNHRYPKYLPYQTITENATGNTIYYMNIYGIRTLRTYVTAQSWDSKGTGFVCGFDTGEMFWYDIEKQTLQYIDTCFTLTDRLCAVMGTDDYIYYPKIDDEGYCGLYKAKVNEIPSKPEFVGRRKDKYQFYTPHISNDGKFFSVDVSIPGNGVGTACRYDVEKDEWIDYRHRFSYSDVMTHALINPEYTELVSFCHELDGASGVNQNNQVYDRVWHWNVETGEAENVYKQGVADYDGKALQGATHEVWSNNGEYMYVINVDLSGESGLGLNTGLTPACVRFDKDGSHRQYFYDHNSNEHKDKHLYPSGDDKFIVADGDVIVLISTETHERFVISNFEWFGKHSGHPWHAHPVVARNKYIVQWGAMDDKYVVGIKWFDFTELAKKTAKSGRYDAGENVDRVSYIGLDSESRELSYKGKKAIMAQKEKAIYLDISDELIDTVDGKVKLSFDYYDNGTTPITLTYTSGVKKENEHWRVFDNFKKIMRTNTNKWKHCEIVIDSGNFENIGKHFSDIKISGTPANVYISNLQVSIPE